jgi:hypothetical protein
VQIVYYSTIIEVDTRVFIVNIRFSKDFMDNSSVQTVFQPSTLSFSIVAAIISTFGVFGNGMVGLRWGRGGGEE